VTVSVGRFEIVGLIGGNGAGKTTLINCISGHLRPDAGTILVAGQDVSALAPEFRPFLGVSRTFQDARLFPGLTVAETIMAAMDGANRSGAIGAIVNAPWVREAEAGKRRRALEILAEFGLAERANTLTGELSTGMRRVCDVAAIVAAEPQLVLLDEPTSGLAQREAEELAPLLRKLRDDHGCSMLVVEHDMTLIMGLCDRIYCLEQGELIAEGTADEVRKDPLVISSYLGAGTSTATRKGTARRDMRAGAPAGRKS
jgi:ABC-type branched-subunit amino acid transport system ATPase component